MIDNYNQLFTPPGFIRRIIINLIISVAPKEGMAVPTLNQTIYTLSFAGSKLTRAALNDKDDVTSYAMPGGLKPYMLVGDQPTRMIYFVHPDRTSIYRMPLAFDTKDGRLLSILPNYCRLLSILKIVGCFQY